MNSVFVIVVFPYVLVLMVKFIDLPLGRWVRDYCLAYRFLSHFIRDSCTVHDVTIFTFAIKHSHFRNTLGESVVYYNSVSFISIKLWAPLQRCGLSSMGGLPLIGNLKRGPCLIEGRAWPNGCHTVDV